MLTCFALCEAFSCGPPELEQWSRQDVEDFTAVLQYRAMIGERQRKTAEAQARG